jgi:hypothetical protein
MIKILSIDEIKKILPELFQSSHISFLIGSGTSFPAIPTAGNIEQRIQELFKKDKDLEANKELYDFLSKIQEITNEILKDEISDEKVVQVLDVYKGFMEALEGILVRREANIIPKQINVFSTNYDPFVEKASERYPNLKLNDGFSRNCNLRCIFEFSTNNFFNSIRNNGNLYGYEVILPSVNLIKIHGSVSWKRGKNNGEDNILFNVESKELLSEEEQKNPERIKNFIEQYALILPQKKKLHETVMDRTHYDLLRLYSNELDKENALLVVIGFSFVDEHIYDITKRALKNPTLNIVIFAFDKNAVEDFKKKFAGHSNVRIVAPDGDNKIRFESVVSDILPINKENKDEQN